MKVSITGANGFVGNSIVKYFGDSWSITKYDRNSIFRIESENIIIHLAGKAHDLMKSSKPSEYYDANTELTQRVFDVFLESRATVFIILSSVKAVADEFVGVLTEGIAPNPLTHYGKSKLLAEQYILSKNLPEEKRVYILRPCIIHGEGNKGNLSLLYKLVSNGIPWPLGAFDNQRSYCNIDNLLFVIKELIEQDDIPSGIYNIADDDALSINEVISILAESQSRIPKIWKFPKIIIYFCARLGNIFPLPLNEERLKKLTESYIVSNEKIKAAIGKPLPHSTYEGLLKTFQTFKNL
jgi:nucleoside-diphosphate-sugar epimerase